MNESTNEPKKSNKKRNHVLLFLALFFSLAGGGYAVYYYNYAQYYESTDNAYVGQNIVYVNPQVSGSIDKVLVSEMQYVKEGSILAHIDSRDEELRFNEAKAKLAGTIRNIKQMHVQKEELKNGIALAQVKLDKAKDDLKRNEFLAKNNAITDERYKNLQFAYEEAEQNLELQQNKLHSLEALLHDANISNNPQVRNAALNVKRCYLDLKRCDILAPTSGIVAKKSLTLGENVKSSSTLLAIVPTTGYWVDANFKETQLKHIFIGQNVTLHSDLYGKDILYHGKVKAIAPGTGAVFSLIPAQNATGNWIKIIQRVPVRITLDEKEVEEHPLQVGNSMNVTIDVHNQDGTKKSALANNTDTPFQPYKDAFKESDAIVQKIIKQNS